MKTFQVITLGCKANQYDSEGIASALEEAGLVRVEVGVPADLCLINTCTVTHEADRKSRQQIRRAVKANPGAQVLATGCAAELHPEKLAALTGVSLVAGNRAKGRIPELLGLVQGSRPWNIRHFGRHTRAFLKIQDGCECFCTYCIIPFVRGRVVSRTPEDLETEARRLAASGHQEIVLTGIHIGSYGTDLEPRRTLSEVLDRLVPIEGLRRIRISSIEAREFSERLLDQIHRFPKLCPHFHIPLQSGSDRILTWMKRRYRAADLLRTVDRLNGMLSEVSYTTDVIVGFPGETDEDFEATLDTARRIGFSKVHVFPYSDREGTPAARLPRKCSPRVIAERCDRLEALARDLALAYKARFLGREVEVLTENERDPETGRLPGYTDRYVRVLIDAPGGLFNRFLKVRIRAVEPEAALGESAGASPAARRAAMSLPVLAAPSVAEDLPCQCTAAE
ncbi:MAG: tRNA (N(6)-L-threonylcarbamoyladenosine(37)-C(2))-methylthiotransferase MtaB [Planctomycetes bacterium]|nr:tRNA (N(6)-L-threonylcarbamoyladenosine(37)-C(2))-methylthiotransferase MtaB [Planctomycetota bacterium]